MRVWDITGNKPEFVMEQKLNLGVLQVEMINFDKIYWMYGATALFFFLNFESVDCFNRSVNYYFYSTDQPII